MISRLYSLKRRAGAPHPWLRANARAGTLGATAKAPFVIKATIARREGTLCDCRRTTTYYKKAVMSDRASWEKSV